MSNAENHDQLVIENSQLMAQNNLLKVRNRRLRKVIQHAIDNWLFISDEEVEELEDALGT